MTTIETCVIPACHVRTVLAHGTLHLTVMLLSFLCFPLGPVPPAVDVIDVPCLPSLEARPPQGLRISQVSSACCVCVVVLHVAEVLYVHLRVTVQRRMFGVREEEHGGQGSRARPARLTKPRQGCSAARDSKGLMWD